MASTYPIIVYKRPIAAVAPFQQYVIDELVRRESNIGEDGTSIKPGSTYKGPLAAWIRVCSNAVYNGKSGFIMNGVAGFEDTFGFYGTSDKSSNMGSPVLGYTADGKGTHILPTSALTLKHRPTPGVNAIDVELAQSVFRNVTIHWTCWSKEQLEYMEKFFMTPSISVVIEWGWNNYNPASLLDLTNIGKPTIYGIDGDGNMKTIQTATPNSLLGVWSDDNVVENMIQTSNGNYDCTMGIIRDFNFKLNKLGGFDCTTVVSSKSGLYSGLSAENMTIVVQGKKQAGIKEWLKNKFPIVLEDVIKQNKPCKLFPHSPELLAKGNPPVETRVFAARSVSDGSGKNAAFYEWDFGNNSSYYVTFGLLIDFFNLYLDETVQGLGCKTRFNIADVWISGHPNLKSANGKVLLIPNKTAPVWTSDQQSAVDPAPGSSNLTQENQVLQDYLGTSNRQNLAKIIAARRGGDSVSFPRYGPQPGLPSGIDPNGYAGKLADLYVSSETVVECFDSHDTFADGLTDLLERVAGAGSGIWSFMVKPIGNIGGGNNDLTIIDTNFIGFKSAKNLYNQASYNFKLSQATSIIEDADFNVKLADSVAYQPFYNAIPSTTGDSTVNNKSIIVAPDNPNDRLFGGPGGRFVNKSADLQISDSDKSAAAAYAGRTNLMGNEYFFFKTDSGIYSLAEAEKTLMVNIIQYTPTSPIQHTGLMPGTELTINILGISGIKFLDYFTCDGLPDKYSTGCIFQVKDVKHKIENNKWTTVVCAGIRPAMSV